MKPHVLRKELPSSASEVTSAFSRYPVLDGTIQAAVPFITLPLGISQTSQTLPVSPSVSNSCSQRSRSSPLPTGFLALGPLHPYVSRVCHATTKTKPSGPQLCVCTFPNPWLLPLRASSLLSRAISSINLAPLPFSLKTIYPTVFDPLDQNIPPNHRTSACFHHVTLAGKHLPVVLKAS